MTYKETKEKLSAKFAKFGEGIKKAQRNREIQALKKRQKNYKLGQLAVLEAKQKASLARARAAEAKASGSAPNSSGLSVFSNEPPKRNMERREDLSITGENKRKGGGGLDII